MLKDHGVIFRIGAWTVRPELNTLARDGQERHIEPKVMKVLLVLAAEQGRVVPKERLMAAVWPDTFVSDDVLTRCISILRRITEDDPHTPRFIQTIPKTGYRLVAEVTEVAEQDESVPPLVEQLAEPTAEEPKLLSEAFEIGTAKDSEYLKAPRSSRHLWISGALFAFFVVAVITGVWFFRGRTANLAFQMIQLTSYAGEQTQPAFSPDGKRIAFVWLSEDGSSRRIYVKTIGSEDAQQLTNAVEGQADDQYSPAWSPDGRQIAYLSSAKDALGLYVADVGARTPPRKLLIPEVMTHWEAGASVSWAPLGKTLIYADHLGIEPHSSIFQVDLDTLSTRSITTPPSGWEGDMNPSYSPDGRWIAFTRASETAVQDLYCMSTVDGRVQQLTHDRMNINSLAWTTDSRGIIFSSNRGGKNALWKVGLNGRDPERLPFGTEDAYEPAVGPKPGELAYTQGSAIWSILRVEEGGSRDGRPEEKAVLTSTQQDSAPSLAPDGKRFAFQSHRSGNQEIWIASTDGATTRQLTFMGTPMERSPLTGSPAWSHVGDRILFDSRPDGHSHIFCVPADGGKPIQLTFGNVNDITPRWSHDDKTIYFRSNRGDRWQIWKIPAVGGDAQPVTTGDGIVPQESIDGQWLYYTRGGEDGLWRVSPAGGAETQVLPQPLSGYWGYWQVTARGIFFLDHSATTNAIRIYDPSTGKTTLFATLRQIPPSNAGITVAGDGRMVLMSGQRDTERHITLIQAQP